MIITMKYLFVVLSLLFGGNLFSQSVEMKHNTVHVNSGDTIEVIGVDPNSIISVHDFELINLTMDTIQFNCKKIETSLLSGTSASFCWGNLCYPAQIFDSPSPAIISPNGFVSDFSGKYNPNAILGTSYVQFVFYNSQSPQDSVFFTAKFVLPEELLVDLATENIDFLLYPNPVNDLVNIEFERLVDSFDIIDNMGQVIETIFPTSNFLSLDISNLEAGMYFVKIKKENEIYALRLIVE